ncbi:MAG: NADH-quinone oxidoreductase subunit L [Acidobacteria bacterium]|nr:NADH-quinone oxidoreductase subunit L [Acidobacteriota bacterium]MBI3279080.1 NADH-quinone oxidoreductase subunit L [Acidobacteriota bacterium]
MVDRAWLIPLLPLASAALMLLAGRRFRHALVNLFCIGSVAAAFVVAVIEARAIAADGSHGRELVLGRWLPFNGADWGLLVDPLSVLMALIVTGVGLLIHIYSAGYMEFEGGYYRYFGFLNLFVSFMLLLVLANNYALLFAGWEGVGLCSYLLIGFFYDRPSANAAANKAFLVNRAGDWGFVMGLLLMLGVFGTVRFNEVNSGLAIRPVEGGFGVLTALAILLFVGAAGKSAQFPLHVWLPDAMEGPTPVSALIHAATMVTAGVYLVARSSALFDKTPEAQALVAAIGALTAILAGSVALVQNDIKRVLAWSTVSQLGFMFMALGVGAYFAAIFHLFTHALFKALLFLGAGAVIHGAYGEQDMRRMGGLRRALPVTHATMLVGALAISGIPGLAGFFSKEEILLGIRGAQPLFAVGLAVSVMTAFYMWRLMRLVFWGAAESSERTPGRNDRAAASGEGLEAAAHEPPAVMTIPLVALAAAAVAGGWPYAALRRWLAPVLPGASQPPAGDWVAPALAVAAALIGIVTSRFAISGHPERVLRNAWFIDPLYHAVFVRGLGLGLGGALARFDSAVVDAGVNATALLARMTSRVLIFWDVVVVDGAVRLTSALVRLVSYPVRILQTGYVQTYALYVIVGLLVMFGIYATRT